MKRAILAAAVGFVLAATGSAMAQNVGNNAGIWWTPAPGQPAAFTFLNPLTTVYGRIGFLRAFPTSTSLQGSPSLGVPATANIPAGWGMMLGLGARLMPVLRYELQLGGTFAVRETDSIGVPLVVQAQVRASSVQLMNNLYLDVAPFFGNQLWGLNPYVFGGLGISWNSRGDANRLFPLPVAPEKIIMPALSSRPFFIKVKS